MRGAITNVNLFILVAWLNKSDGTGLKCIDALPDIESTTKADQLSLHKEVAKLDS